MHNAYLVQYAVRSIILRLRQTMQHMYMYRYRYTCAHVHVQFRDAAVQRAAACTCTCSISLYASHLADLLVGDTAELLASSQSAASDGYVCVTKGQVFTEVQVLDEWLPG